VFLIGRQVGISRRILTSADVVARVMASEHADFVREAVALVARELMEAEISVEVGAELGEVLSERTARRNGYRPRPWVVGAGEKLAPLRRLRFGVLLIGRGSAV
jgi:transposase-like protein